MSPVAKKIIIKEKESNGRSYWEQYQDLMLSDFFEQLAERNRELGDGNRSHLILQEYYRDVSVKGIDSKTAFEKMLDRAYIDLDRQDFSNPHENLVQFMDDFAKLQLIQRTARSAARSLITEAQNEVAGDNPDISLVDDSIEYIYDKFINQCRDYKEKYEPEKDARLIQNAVDRFIEVIENNLDIYIDPTAHPTNKPTKEYTIAVNEYEQLRENTTPEQRKAAMRKIVDAPIAGPKKTVSDEFEEFTSTLKSMKEGSSIFGRRFREVSERKLAQANDVFSREQIRDMNQVALEKTIKSELVKIGAWPLGDGDGNFKQNKYNLKEGIDELRSLSKDWFSEDYTQLLDKIRVEPLLMTQLYNDILNIQRDIKEGDIDKSYSYILDVLSGLDEKIESSNFNKIEIQKLKDIREDIRDLASDHKTFGQTLSKFNVRHNAIDIIDTYAKMIEVAVNDEEISSELGLSIDDKEKKEFEVYDLDKNRIVSKEMTEREYVDQLIQRTRVIHANKKNLDNFASEEIEFVEKALKEFGREKEIPQKAAKTGIFKTDRFLKKLLPEDKRDEQDIDRLKDLADSNRPFRLLGRFQLFSKDENLDEKGVSASKSIYSAIIAEFFNEHQAGIVADIYKSLDIVKPITPLFESEEDLEKAPTTLVKMLLDDNFKRLVEKTGKFITMCAKSDTTRQSGPLAKYPQQDMMAKSALIYAIKDEAGNNLLPENAEQILFDGGGNSINRSGGKETEVAYARLKTFLRQFDREGNLKQDMADKFLADIKKETGQDMSFDKDRLESLYISSQKLAQELKGELSQDQIERAEKPRKLQYPKTQITVQGHQQHMHFNPPSSFARYLEALVSQSFNASLKLAGVFPDVNEVSQAYEAQGMTLSEIEAKESKAYNLENIAYKASTTFYNQRVFGSQDAFHQAMVLSALATTPKEIIVGGNTGARPDTRPGEGNNTAKSDGQKTWIQFFSKVIPNFFKNRAIGVDEMVRGEGTIFTAIVSSEKYYNIIANDGEEVGNIFDNIDKDLTQKQIDRLHETYNFSKTSRDVSRERAILLAMVSMDEYSHAWNMVGGKDFEKGDKEYDRLMGLAKNFVQNPDYFKDQDKTLENGEIDPSKFTREEMLDISRAKTLYLEESYKKIAKDVYASITGQPHTKMPDGSEREGEFTMQTALRDIWPVLNKEVEYLMKNSEAVSPVYVKLNEFLKDKFFEVMKDPSKGDEPIPENLDLFIGNVSASMSLVNTPIFMALTLTQRGDEKSTNVDPENTDVKTAYEARLKEMYPDRVNVLEGGNRQVA